MTSPADIAVIIPVFNEAQQLDHLIPRICSLQQQAVDLRVVDGGSTDGTFESLAKANIPVIRSGKGRAIQMNTGYRSVAADCYLFLHADCVLPESAISDIRETLRTGRKWGRFDVRLSGHSPVFRMIERMMNWRSCLTQVMTGDQGIFVEATLLHEIGGVPDIPLMEDIALSKRLRQSGRGGCIRSRMLVSSRRWEKSGIIYMTLLMWWLRLRYFFGADPADLYKSYYGQPG